MPRHLGEASLASQPIGARVLLLLALMAPLSLVKAESALAEVNDQEKRKTAGGGVADATAAIVVATAEAAPMKAKREHGKIIEGCERIVIAPPRASGNLVEDNRRKQAHLCLGDVVRWCQDHPDKILSVQSLMHTGSIQASNLTSGRNDAIALQPFHATYQFLARIPKYWVMWFLMRLAPDIFTPTVVAAIDKVDKDNIRRIFDLATATTQTMRWPSEAKSWDVLYRLMKQRADRVGNRMTKVWADNIASSGAINWATAGAFTLVVENIEGKETVRVAHISGLRADLPARAGITTQDLDMLEIADPIHDRSAFLDLGGLDLKLHTRFPKGQGPNIEMIASNDASAILKTQAAMIANEVAVAPLTEKLSHEQAVVQSETSAAKEIVEDNDQARKKLAAATRKATTKPSGPALKKLRVCVGTS